MSKCLLPNTVDFHQPIHFIFLFFYSRNCSLPFLPFAYHTGKDSIPTASFFFFSSLVVVGTQGDLVVLDGVEAVPQALDHDHLPVLLSGWFHTLLVVVELDELRKSVLFDSFVSLFVGIHLGENGGEYLSINFPWTSLLSFSSSCWTISFTLMYKFSVQISQMSVSMYQVTYVPSRGETGTSVPS